jgi:putative endonuclease
VTATRFSLYIVRCANGSLYTGIAANVQKRLAEHEAGPRGARYLRGKGPLEVVFTEVVGNRARASRLEHRVKRLNRARKLALIDGRLELSELIDDQVLEEELA